MSERNISKADILDVTGAWSIGSVTDVSEDALGTINRTWLVSAVSGRYALRLSCHRDEERLEREIGVIAFVVSQGVPALLPVQCGNDSRYLDRDGLWTLTPFAPGRQTDRDDMSLEQDRGMGRFLARLLDALSSCPSEYGRRRTLRLNSHDTLEQMDRYERLICDLPDRTLQDDYALDRLRGRRKWILENDTETLDGLLERPQQVIHGDYQEKNVFFDGRGEVVALIDWDNAWVAPREWEILRTLNFVMGFDPTRGRAFVEGYLEGAALDLDTLDRAASSYGAERTHQLYLYEDIYDHGNERARRFVRPGPFSPVYDRWVPLRDALTDLMG